MTLTIQLATEKHINAIATILHTEWYDSVEEAQQEVTKRVSSQECVIACSDTTIVGILMYAREYSHCANYCEDLIVHKDHRRKGIGLALLKKYVEISKIETPKKQKYALSSTDVNNTASQALHKKAGFKDLGVLKQLHFGRDELFFGFDLSK